MRVLDAAAAIGEIPDGATVFVTFNNAQASDSICKRLRGSFPEKDFRAPPPVRPYREELDAESEVTLANLPPKTEFSTEL